MALRQRAGHAGGRGGHGPERARGALRGGRLFEPRASAGAAAERGGQGDEASVPPLTTDEEAFWEKVHRNPELLRKLMHYKDALAPEDTEDTGWPATT